MPVDQAAAALMGMQHIHQLVPMLLTVEAAKGWALGQLELHQVHGGPSIND